MESLTTSQKLSVAMTAMPDALDREMPEATRLRRIRWVLRLLKGLGEQ